MRKALQVSISIAHSSAVNEVCSYTNVSQESTGGFSSRKLSLMKSEFYLTWSKLYFLDEELGNPNSQELGLDQETRGKKIPHHFQVTIKLCFQYKMITFKLGDISISLWLALYMKTLCHLVSFKKVFTKDSVRANQRPLCSLIRTMSSGQGRRTGNEPIACASVQGPEMLFQGKQQFKDSKEERKRIKKREAENRNNKRKLENKLSQKWAKVTIVTSKE